MHTFEGGTMINKIIKNEQILFFTRYIAPYKYKLMELYCITVIINVLGLLPIYFMGKIINYVTNKEFNNILHTIMILFVVFLVSSVFNVRQTYLHNFLNNKISKMIKIDIFNKALYIPINRLNDTTSGHIISLIEGDAEKVVNFYVLNIVEIVVTIVTLIVSLFFLIKSSFSLTMIAITAFMLGILINFFSNKKIGTVSENLRKVSDMNFNFLNESLNGIKEVKSYVMESKLANKFHYFAEQVYQNNMKLSSYLMLSNMINACSSSMADWLIIGYGTWKIINEKLLIGTYVAFNGFLGTFFNAVKELMNINVMFRTIFSSLNRIYTFLSISEEKSYRKKEITYKNFANADIFFDNVCFSYKEGTKYVLNKLKVKFKKQNISVIIGKNGVGKSTIFSLIEQFYVHYSGNIYIGDTNIKDINLECIRRNIGLVQQHPVIISGSVRDNLLFGNGVVNDSILDKVCADVGLTEYINGLEKGYDTYLNGLSGGQMQRLAIARALIKNPSILLLDEITSDLDGKTEKEIINLLIKLSKTKTIILISHRINAIISIPNIYVMDYGKIVDYGDNAKLSKGCVLYSLLTNCKE